MPDESSRSLRPKLAALPHSITQPGQTPASHQNSSTCFLRLDSVQRSRSNHLTPNNDNQPSLVSLNDACRLTSMSRTMLNRYRADGRFPAAVTLGERRIAFVRAEVQTWISERIARRAAA